MAREYVLIGVSFLIGVLCIRKLQDFDLYEREPFLKMLAVAVWGGFWAIVVSLLLYRTAALVGVRAPRNFLGALLVIGPVEELAKLLALFSCYWLIRKELTEPTDGILYMACVALGFSLIENYFYAATAARPGAVLFVRLLVCTPSHICFTVFMGLAFYVVVKHRRGGVLLLLSFLYAGFAHGLYDAAVFHGAAFLIVFAGVLALSLLGRWLLGYTAAISPHRRSLAEVIASFPGAPVEAGLPCLHCGSTNPKATYRHGRIRIQKCDGCECYVTTKAGLWSIFRHFGLLSELRLLRGRRRRRSTCPSGLRILIEANCFSDDRKLAFFRLDELNGVLERLIDRRIRDMHRHWWFPVRQRDVAGTCLALDAAGVPATPASPEGTLRWTERAGGEEIAAARFAVRMTEDRRQVLALACAEAQAAAPRITAQSIPLETVLRRFGPPRRRFRCPLIRGGRLCGRRTDELYLPLNQSEFGCRRCHGLSRQACVLSRRPVWQPGPRGLPGRP